MKRARSFAALVAAALGGIVILTAWYLWNYQPKGGSVTDVMGQMMGYGGNTLAPMPGSVWGLLVALLLVVSIGVVGAAYYAAYPEIGSRPSQERPAQVKEDRHPGMSWTILMRTSKPEEAKVLDVLAAHDGRYLQKFIVKESGLSRLKTHRILSRFAERGIVVAEKSGNTNEIALAPWLHPETNEA